MEAQSGLTKDIAINQGGLKKAIGTKTNISCV